MWRISLEKLAKKVSFGPWPAIVLWVELIYSLFEAMKKATAALPCNTSFNARMEDSLQDTVMAITDKSMSLTSSVAGQMTQSLK